MHNFLILLSRSCPKKSWQRRINAETIRSFIDEVDDELYLYVNAARGPFVSRFADISCWIVVVSFWVIVHGCFDAFVKAFMFYPHNSQPSSHAFKENIMTSKMITPVLGWK